MTNLVAIEFKSLIEETPGVEEGNFLACIDGYCAESKGIKYPMLQAERYFNTKEEAEAWLVVIKAAYKD